MTPSLTTARTLLEADEPAAFEIVNPAGMSNVVLICDHASNRVPRSLQNLGLDAQQLQEHISWDPGAAAVARLLSAALDAPLILSGYSRLVIDCNRPLQSHELIAEKSADVTVPGNQNLSAAERQLRIDTLFHPYHQAIENLLEQRCNRPNYLLSIHSFTPRLNNEDRPWHIGVSFKSLDHLTKLLFAALEADESICVGFNQPYPIEDAFDYSIPNHGDKHGLHSTMIEIRQDGLQTAANVALWAKRLEQAYRLIEEKI